MGCTSSTTLHAFLSRNEDNERKRRQDSAYVTARSHEKPGNVDDFPQRFTETQVISKLQLVDKRQGHNT